MIFAPVLSVVEPKTSLAPLDSAMVPPLRVRPAWAMSAPRPLMRPPARFWSGSENSSVPPNRLSWPAFVSIVPAPLKLMRLLESARTSPALLFTSLPLIRPSPSMRPELLTAPVALNVEMRDASRISPLFAAAPAETLPPVRLSSEPGSMLSALVTARVLPASS